MGRLPPERVQRSRAFSNADVDFAGPFSVTAFRGRRCKSHKAYIALFVCLATKAIHLELVNDLTTLAFIAAFKIFTARRGQCSKLFSDNGTNFRGADAELRRMTREAVSFHMEVSAQLAASGTV